MRRLWNEIKDHQLASAAFLVYWLTVFGLYVFRWHKPEKPPAGMSQSVLYLHFLLPVIAGAIVSWWRRSKPGGITASMLVGVAVVILDTVAVLTWQFVEDFRYWESGSNEEKSVFEVLVVFIAFGLFGALLGLIGAAGATGFDGLLDRWRNPVATLVSLFPDQPAEGDGEVAVKTRLGDAEKAIPRRLQRVAAGLAWGAAVAVLFGVMPPLAADNIALTAPRAIPAFAVNAILNLLIGVVLLVPVSRLSAGAGKVVVVVCGFASLLLGFALLDAASRLLAHLMAWFACLAAAAGDFGAGVLALFAARRRQGRNCAGPVPVS